jgi:hypothetical protein
VQNRAYLLVISEIAGPGKQRFDKQSDFERSRRQSVWTLSTERKGGGIFPSFGLVNSLPNAES